MLVPECGLDTAELCQLAVEGWHELTTLLPACTQSASQRSCEQSPEPDLKAEQVDSCLCLQGADSLVRDSNMSTLASPIDNSDQELEGKRALYQKGKN